MRNFQITVFGGSQSLPGDPSYDEAYRLGKLLGEKKWTVLTGGYIGTMEAVSRGAAEAGSHVIGITCEDIERWRPVAPNKWVMEERRFTNLRTRLLALIDNCDAAIALPGGVGTLTEIMMTWNQLLTNAIEPRPLILVGENWQAIMTCLFNQLGSFIPDKQRAWLLFAPTIEFAVSILQEYHRSGKVYPD